MEITDIKFRHLQEVGRLKALVSVTFDGVFAVHDIKIIDGQDRLFLAMPSRRMPDGKYRDIVHPIGRDLRAVLYDKVFSSYNFTLLQLAEGLTLKCRGGPNGSALFQRYSYSIISGKQRQLQFSKKSGAVLYHIVRAVCRGKMREISRLCFVYLMALFSCYWEICRS